MKNTTPTFNVNDIVSVSLVSADPTPFQMKVEFWTLTPNEESIRVVDEYGETMELSREMPSSFMTEEQIEDLLNVWRDNFSREIYEISEVN